LKLFKFTQDWTTVVKFHNGEDNRNYRKNETVRLTEAIYKKAKAAGVGALAKGEKEPAS
jgi:hypothetical protein